MGAPCSRCALQLLSRLHTLAGAWRSRASTYSALWASFLFRNMGFHGRRAVGMWRGL